MGYGHPESHLHFRSISCNRMNLLERMLSLAFTRRVTATSRRDKPSLRHTNKYGSFGTFLAFTSRNQKFLLKKLILSGHSVRKAPEFSGCRFRQCILSTIFIQGNPMSIFGKYLFGRRFQIYNFRNICCKISCLPASPRISNIQKWYTVAHFQPIFTLKKVT